jgi:FkbM family methyltransferase
MSYFDFVNKINKNDVKTIFELGSRDLDDAIKLYNYFNCKIYSFECNPDCLIECNKRLSKFNENQKNKIILVEKAISLTNGDVSFYPFDLNKYNNMGSSSMFKIDFSKRNKNDPDYNRTNPQKEIIVPGIRLDTFISENNITDIDLLCIDLQGYELNALKSLGNNLHNVKYIITECSIKNTYIGGCSFKELYIYLKNYGFEYVTSNKFGDKFPNMDLDGFSEFDALFIKK